MNEMHIEDWPDCTTPDCQYKVCLWAKTDLCARCSVLKLGVEEYLRRFSVAHYNEFLKLHKGDVNEN